MFFLTRSSQTSTHHRSTCTITQRNSNCVLFSLKLTLFFVASSVDVMHSGQRAGNAHGKHKSHRKTGLFSRSKSKHYQQSVLPTQANVNCMCSSIRRISKHSPNRQKPHCGTSWLNSRTQKHLYLTLCSEVVVQVDRTGRIQQQHKQICDRAFEWWSLAQIMSRLG